MINYFLHFWVSSLEHTNRNVLSIQADRFGLSRLWDIWLHPRTMEVNRIVWAQSIEKLHFEKKKLTAVCRSGTASWLLLVIIHGPCDCFSGINKSGPLLQLGTKWSRSFCSGKCVVLQIWSKHWITNLAKQATAPSFRPPESPLTPG